MFEMNQLPVNPGLVLAALGYCAVSALITGPEMTEREIDRSTWSEICAIALRADLEATRAPRQTLPDVPDVSAILRSISPELGPLFEMIPDPMAGTREAARQAEAKETYRIERAAKSIPDQCDCAVIAYTASERLNIALWAGSVRLYTPTVVETRKPALTKALYSPACQFAGRNSP